MWVSGLALAAQAAIAVYARQSGADAGAVLDATAAVTGVLGSLAGSIFARDVYAKLTSPETDPDPRRPRHDILQAGCYAVHDLILAYSRQDSSLPPATVESLGKLAAAVPAFCEKWSAIEAPAPAGEFEVQFLFKKGESLRRERADVTAAWTAFLKHVMREDPGLPAIRARVLEKLGSAIAAGFHAQLFEVLKADFDSAGSPIKGRAFASVVLESLLSVAHGNQAILAVVNALDPRAAARHEASMAAHAQTQAIASQASEDVARLRHELGGEPLQRYRQRLLDSYASYDEIGFDLTSEGDAEQRVIQLTDIFVAPTCTAERTSPETFDARLAAGEHPARALLPLIEGEQLRRTVLLADPGMGKSTLIRWLIVTLAAGVAPAGAPGLRGCIPLPFIVRDLVRYLPDDPAAWTWPALLAAFRSFKTVATAAEPLLHPFQGRDFEFNTLLQSEHAFFLIDGLDEIGDPAKRLAFRDAVWAGFKTHRAAQWLVTSRIIGYEGAEVDKLERRILHKLDAPSLKLPLEVTPGFQEELDALGVRNREVFNAEVIGPGWTVSIRIATRRYLAPWDDSQQDAFARQWFIQRKGRETGEARAKGLLDEVRDPARARGQHGIRTIARVPNLLALMALLKLRGLPLPDGRAELYSKIAEAYLKTIDEAYQLGAKHGHTRPCTYVQAARWLSIVAIFMQERHADARAQEAEAGTARGGEILATTDDLHGWLGPVVAADFPELPPEGVRETIALYLRHLAHRSGLLQPRAEGDYGFAHLSFLEYFAACYLASERERLVRRDARWAQHFRKGITTSEADLDRDYRPGPIPFREEDFPALAAQAAWHEVLVFLVESRVAEKDDLLRWLFPALHDGAAPPAPPPAEGAEPAPFMPLDAVTLAVQLASDRLLAVDEGTRRAWWAHLWGAYLAWPHDPRHHDAALRWNIAPSLLTGAEQQREVLEVLARCVHERQLTNLTLFHCAGLTDLTPLQGLGSLQWLALTGCTAVSDLTPLQGLGSLQSLFLEGCTAVSELTPLQGLGSLQRLSLNGCHRRERSHAAPGPRQLADAHARRLHRRERGRGGGAEESLAGLQNFPVTDQ